MMKNKKIILLFIFLLVIILIVVAVCFGNVQIETNETIEEYIPQEEISETKPSDTIVTLYFPNTETNKVMPEARTVSVKDIMKNPYTKILEMLIEGPVSNKLSKVIPADTIILGTDLQGETLTVNFSKEILNYEKEDGAKNNMIKSIVNSLTELSEVNKVKFQVEGIQNNEFENEYTRM